MAAELLTRLFERDIQQKLFPSWMWMNRSLNDDSYVNNNSVELPHSGTIPAVEVDRSSLPATIAKRTDAATQYLLEELTTDPTLIQDSEELTVAYNKRASVIDHHISKIRAKASARCAYKWAGGAATYRATTGSSRTATGPSQTGNRKAVTLADLSYLKGRFHQDDITPENEDIMGNLLLTPQMYMDLLAIEGVYSYDKYGSANLPDGVVDRIYGFNIFIRSAVAVLNNSDALKAEGAAAAATDQDAAIAWHPSYVRKALGSIKVYIDNDKPEYYGSVLSTMVRFGALYARNDNKGIYLMFEDTP